MTIAHRLTSLSLLGVMALTLAPLASAQSFGGSLRGRGHFGLGNADIDSETRAEIRAELRACKEENQDDREAMKACADAVLANYGIERPERPERPEISDEVRAELEACRDNNPDDREAGKACADAVFEANGIERPEHRPGRRIKRRVRGNIRSTITEACGEREDTDEWRECAQSARSEFRSDFKEEHPRAYRRIRNRGGLFGSADLRTELRACLELDDQDELRECVFGVRAEARANAAN